MYIECLFYRMCTLQNVFFLWNLFSDSLDKTQEKLECTLLMLC